MQILHIAGARPNFMKIAPLIKEIGRYPDDFQQKLLHTGQHYDETMSDIFFSDLGIPHPDIHLGIGSGTHAVQTGRIMIEIEPVLLKLKPDLVLVVGDVNSTLACSLVASKLEIPVAHVEAGLRSFDRRMPEEINRLLTDQIADYLFTTDMNANKNLLNEGIAEYKIHFVGNVMIDSLLSFKEKALETGILANLGLVAGEYALLPLHRPSNVDDRKVLQGILEALIEIQTHQRIIFPVHPRTKKRIIEFGMSEMVEDAAGLQMMDPVGYLEFLNLMANASFVLTDSGGIQEETTILGVPCCTLRENTERPITITMGTNVLAGCEKEKIVKLALKFKESTRTGIQIPEFWDGRAAERIVKVLRKLGPDQVTGQN